MPRILIATQVFYPSHDAVSQLLVELASGLVEAGVEVHVLTAGVNYMTGDALKRHEIFRGVRIWRVPSVKSDKANLLSRSLSYGAFLALFEPALALIPKPEVIFYLSTPPMLGWSAGLAKKLCGARTVFVAEDVYPEILKASGLVKSELIFGALSRLDRTALEDMDRVVVLGERMKEVMLGKGVEPSRLRVIENFAVAPGIGTAARKNNPLLAECKLEDRFVVEYSGNMGVAHDMTPILDAADILKSDRDTVFLFMGGGKRRGEVEKEKARRRLSNVAILPYQPFERLGVSLAAADVSLISLRPEMEGLVFPSKFYGILASARPVVFIGDKNGEIARILERAKCGIAARNGRELAEAIVRLKNDGHERAEMGARAREYFDANYGKERSLAKYRELIDELTVK